jgi:hypothetical protein
MHWRKSGLTAALVLMGGLLCAQEPDQVTVKILKYPDLGNRIKELKGKIIVVDFWADT